jgi:hypothetical protein
MGPGRIMKRKARSVIPREIAAEVLFKSDRTCCVCRVGGKPVQIHHLDEDPANQAAANLAVLCFDCHRDTQIRGGFDRKLDSEQIVLYRDDWITIVSRRRAAALDEDGDPAMADRDVATDLSIAEIYREAGEYELLAIHYSHLGNEELRDKYIERVLSNEPRDSTIIFLRELQGRIDLVPAEVIERELARYTGSEDRSQRARFFASLGRVNDAVKDYCRTVTEGLEEGNTFAAAYYLKELCESGLGHQLFVQALRDAGEARDIWWQVRSLQELGWVSELNALLVEKAEEVEVSGNPLLLELLAAARHDTKAVAEYRKEIARGTKMAVVGEDD